ncbi:LETM1 domain-containing protein 1 [Patella vulgata]|uniref:LETM1 domain-containing protein 1 n=1 Tax=Patella vulgata TaxID=6465 RepID=UPI0024A857C1|nr:LETM1 domain-containing protein 1 [Patella vulgata]
MVKKQMDFYKKSENHVVLRYPKVYKIYHTFKAGMKGFFHDFKIYYRVITELWGGKDLSDFSRVELEVYTHLPKAFWRLTPLLVVSGIPFGSSVFPLAYMFPRFLLSHHFWTPEQRIQFYTQDLKKQIEHYSPIIQSLKFHSRHITDDNLQKKIRKIVGKLEHNVLPTTDEILQVKSLFNGSPYHIDRISITYLRHLAKSYGMSLRRKKLKQSILLLLYTDKAMVKEGIPTLLNDELERACFVRGLNPIGLRREERITFLIRWTQISQNIDESSISLLLHSPVLLTSAQPTNLSLKKKKSRWQKVSEET